MMNNSTTTTTMIEKETKAIIKTRSRKERKARLIELFRSVSYGVVTLNPIILTKKSTEKKGDVIHLTIYPLNKKWTHFWLETGIWGIPHKQVGPATVRQLTGLIKEMGFSPLTKS